MHRLQSLSLVGASVHPVIGCPTAPTWISPPSWRTREMSRYLKVVDHPTRGPYYTGAMPFRFSRTPLDEPWTNADPLEPSMTLGAALSLMSGKGGEDGRSG